MINIINQLKDNKRSLLHLKIEAEWQCNTELIESTNKKIKQIEDQLEKLKRG